LAARESFGKEKERKKKSEDRNSLQLGNYWGSEKRHDFPKKSRKKEKKVKK